ncbi:DUF6797 domain-containing protein [Pirellulaceae bacterium SH501]
MIRRVPYIAAVLLSLFVQRLASAQTLESELQSKPIAELVEKSKRLGDPSRGALVYHLPQMACRQCHEPAGDSGIELGPNLTDLGAHTTDESLVESVLWPSKTIRKDFEAVSIRTNEGEIVSGVLVERNQEATVLRDIARGGAIRRISAEDIEDWKSRDSSIMPTGQINALKDAQQFYDLIRYLIEIRDGGPERAKQLKPTESAIAALLASSIPEYEKDLDHVGFIRAWDRDAYVRGEAIYKRVCGNCHGTLDQPGSLPTSLRFAEGQFKNGSDPLSMYRTLTYGFGQMAAQSWMVPSQKYDVIHYIREFYLSRHNPSQLTRIDDDYLARLPKGSSRGPEPSKIEAWSSMDYGPSLAHTFEVPGARKNFAYKGIAVRLDGGAGGVARGRHWMLFDTDTLRMAAAWSAKTDRNATANAKTSEDPSFIDWRGIQFNGEHGIHPSVVGEIGFSTSQIPGWANPATGSFADDQRVLGRDQKRYGPLPRNWGRLKGVYHHGSRTIFSYSIGDTDVVESPGFLSADEQASKPIALRILNIGPRTRGMELQVAEHPATAVPLQLNTIDDYSIAQLAADSTSKRDSSNVQDIDGKSIVAAVWPPNPHVKWSSDGSRLTLKIAPGQESLSFAICQPLHSDSSAKELENSLRNRDSLKEDLLLQEFTKGGPSRWPQPLRSPVVAGSENGPFAVDQLVAPESNPWLALMRFTGLDFFSDGSLAVCTWDGDVWHVKPGSDNGAKEWEWRRIASGMFQPLGLKVISDKIHVTCRDQLCVLHDLNGDAEIDFYECLNNDHQVTEHFHEFAMGLQVDAEGNFYYAKSGCHGKAAIVPHHGTLLKVSRDGTKTTILANGFRAANGVCLNPDGSFFVTDQEGFWNPKNRINWVTLSESGHPKFYGNMLGYHDVTDTSDSAMEPPLCWITNAFDRSPAELLWVESPKWGKLHGRLLNLSYGYGKVFLVPHERVDGKMQGGMIELPLPSFPTGVMRGRFHPKDEHLYLCGMFAWAGNATAPGGLYRIRATNRPVCLPVELRALRDGIQLGFTEPLDKTSVQPDAFSVSVWGLERTAKYGSKHIDEKDLAVSSVILSQDGTAIDLKIDGLKPTWGMQIQYSLRTASGESIQGTLHNTIHTLPD